MSKASTLQRRRRTNVGAERRNRKDPSPAEIHQACREIRAEWTAREYRRRAGELRTRWTVPEVTPRFDFD